tara:strand:- start:355 stop:498 length:144 start_codon:yes stop_codon:yes gene_type:complete
MRGGGRAEGEKGLLRIGDFGAVFTVNIVVVVIDAAGSKSSPVPSHLG